MKKVAGLIGLAYVPEKREWLDGAISDLCAICDEVFILLDDLEKSALGDLSHYPNIRSIIEVHHPKENALWNDFSNHCILMMEAARFEYPWVFWLDHDERLWPKPDKELLHKLVDELDVQSALSSCELPWLTLWNDEQTVRTNIGYLGLKKPFLQRNPFLTNVICFTSTPKVRLHDWPTQAGIQVYRQHFGVLHYGLMTVEQRKERISRYLAVDSQNPKRFMVPKSIEEFDKDAETMPLSEVKLTDYKKLF